MIPEASSQRKGSEIAAVKAAKGMPNALLNIPADLMTEAMPAILPVSASVVESKQCGF